MTDNIDSKYSSFLSYFKYALYATTATVFTPLLVLGLLAKLSMAYFVIDGASLLALMLLDYSGSKKLPQIEVPRLTAPPAVQPVVNESAVSLSDFAKNRGGLEIKVIEMFAIYLKEKVKDPSKNYTPLRLMSAKDLEYLSDGRREELSCTSNQDLLCYLSIEPRKNLNCASYEEFVQLKENLKLDFFENDHKCLLPFCNFSEEDFKCMNALAPEYNIDELHEVHPKEFFYKEGSLAKFLADLKIKDESLYDSEETMSIRYFPERLENRENMLNKIKCEELKEKVKRVFNSEDKYNSFSKKERDDLGSSFKDYFMLSNKSKDNFSLCYWRDFDLTDEELKIIEDKGRLDCRGKSCLYKDIGQLQDGKYIIRTGDDDKLGHYIAMRIEDGKATIWDSLHCEVSEHLKQVLRKHGIIEFESVKEGKIQITNDCGSRAILAVRGEFNPKHNNAQHVLEEEFKDFYRWTGSQEAKKYISHDIGIDTAQNSLDNLNLEVQILLT